MEKKETPQRNLRRFFVVGREPEKVTFRFAERNASFNFSGTFRFADYTKATLSEHKSIAITSQTDRNCIANTMFPAFFSKHQKPPTRHIQFLALYRQFRRSMPFVAHSSMDHDLTQQSGFSVLRTPSSTKTQLKLPLSILQHLHCKKGTPLCVSPQKTWQIKYSQK